MSTRSLLDVNTGIVRRVNATIFTDYPARNIPRGFSIRKVLANTKGLGWGLKSGLGVLGNFKVYGRHYDKPLEPGEAKIIEE
jgi:hypothetical protein